MESSPSPFSAAPPRHTCLNHPEAQTERRCGQCGQPFCEDCLVEIQGRPVCATCKALVLRDMQRKGSTQNRQANDAFMWSLLGMLLCAFLLPIGLFKGIQALQQYKLDPTLPDRWKALAAVIISSVMLGIYALYWGWLILMAVSGGF